MSDVRILEDLIPLQCVGHKETVNYKEAIEKEWLMCLECHGFICPDCALVSQNEMQGQCPNGFFEEQRAHQLKPFPIAPRILIQKIERACENRKQYLSPLIQDIGTTWDELNQVWSDLRETLQFTRALSRSLEWIQDFLYRKPSPLAMLERQATILRLQLEQQQARIVIDFFPSIKDLKQRLLEIEAQVQQLRTSFEMFSKLSTQENQELLVDHVTRLKKLESSLVEKKNEAIILFRDLKHLKKEIHGKEEQEDRQVMDSVTQFLEMVLARTLRNARISTQSIEPFIQLNKALASFLPQLLVGGSDIEQYRRDVERTIEHVRLRIAKIQEEVQKIRNQATTLIASAPYSDYLENNNEFTHYDSFKEKNRVEKMTSASMSAENFLPLLKNYGRLFSSTR